jgi:hypothetical protein
MENRFLVPEYFLELEPPPAKLFGAFRRDVFPRYATILYEMSVTGFGTRIAICERLSIPKGGTRTRLFNNLKELGFIETLNVKLTRHSTFQLVRLTQRGIHFCLNYDWRIRESEWERMIKHHQGERQIKHTAAVLVCAYLARKHKIQAKVLPEMPEKCRSFPDLLFYFNGKPIYVEVEVESRKRDKKGKWYNLYKLQKQIAFITITETQRKNLKEQQRRNHWSSRSTSINTLLDHLRYSVPLTPDLFWVEND